MYWLNGQPHPASLDTAQIIAERCWDVNQAMRVEIGETSNPMTWKYLGDRYPDIRNGYVGGVLFYMGQPDSSPRDQHEIWCLVKQREGWTYGEREDSKLKTHPNLVPWEQLPIEQRLKDVVFQGIVRAVKRQS